MKTVQPHSKFFIIGNADEHKNIANSIGTDDFVIRFNNPNPSCNLMADWVFIANGTIQIRHLIIKNDFFKPDTNIFFRYKINDILKSKYEVIPFDKKLKYCWRFPCWKKKYKLNQYTLHTIPESIYFKCANLVKPNLPSTGLLAIYYILQEYPNNKIYLHNFTHQGWMGHNWSLEESLINKLSEKNKIEFI
ncbi:hypothetical protein [Snodgrassella alvi]|uniref:hypothetical protein n=1 Tax=Snodgrassella alvi TaxID=1196083 RepID=UPI0029E336B0|nr:hypothetical protein [Snodgrassella alvi]